MTDAGDSSGGVRPAGPSKFGYFNQIHLELVALLVVIFSGLVASGWALRPPSGGFPKVPEDLALMV
jgi:hypothetical protein